MSLASSFSPPPSSLLPSYHLLDPAAGDIDSVASTPQVRITRRAPSAASRRFRNSIILVDETGEVLGLVGEAGSVPWTSPMQDVKRADGGSQSGGSYSIGAGEGGERPAGAAPTSHGQQHGGASHLPLTPSVAIARPSTISALDPSPGSISSVPQSPPASPTRPSDAAAVNLLAQQLPPADTHAHDRHPSDVSLHTIAAKPSVTPISRILAPSLTTIRRAHSRATRHGTVTSVGGSSFHTARGATWDGHDVSKLAGLPGRLGPQSAVAASGTSAGPPAGDVLLRYFDRSEVVSLSFCFLVTLARSLG